MLQTIRNWFILVFIFCGSFVATAQVYNGSGGAISNDSLPNFYSLNISTGASVIDSNFGVYGVVVNISHTYDADLNIFLVSPNGITAELSTKNGGSGDNYTNTIFTNNTSNKITNANPPFTGSFKPEASLAVVNSGQNPNGVWKLLIVDTKKSADVGTLLGWSIILSSNPSKFVPFTSSNLPLMIITTNGVSIPDEPKIQGRMCIINNDTSANYLSDSTKFYNHRILIESRGSSSQMFPKKPYGFFTVDANDVDSNTTLIGLPPEHNWVLNATYDDKSLMRDVLAYEMARRTGRYASRWRYCELFINGEYEGIYILLEKIKRDNNRVDIAKLKYEDTTGVNLTGGYIVKIDKTTGSFSGGWTDSFPTYQGSPYRIFFQYDYPELADMAPQQAAYIKNYIYLFENALYGSQFTSPTQGYRQYADVSSFIDLSIINEMSKNVDGYRLSTYFFKDKDSKGGKLTMGPVWDYNLAWNNADYGNSSITSGWEIDLSSTAPFWWKRLRQDTAYMNAYYCRWSQLRKTTFSFHAISNFLDSTYAKIKDASYRNTQRWPVLGLYVWPNPSPLAYTVDDEIYALKDWIYNRFLWIDNELSVYCNATTACKVGVSVTADKTTICKNQSVKLYADGIGNSYTWRPTTGLNVNSGREVIATLDSTRTYRVVMLTPNGCTDTAYITINVVGLPAKSITGNTSICRGSNTILTASPGAVSYKWSPTSTLDNPFSQTVKASPSLTTTYKMVATNAAGCSDSSTITITVNSVAVININASTDTACFDEPVTLTATGGNTYKWLPANGLNDSAGTTVIVKPTSETTYKVIGTTQAGCADTGIFTLHLYPKSFLQLSATSTLLCAGDSTTITVSGGTNIRWLPTSGFNGDSSSSIRVAPTVPTLFKVVGTNAHGCIDTSGILIVVNQKPHTFITAADTNFCKGKSVLLQAQGAINYRWIKAKGLNDSTGNLVMVQPDSTTTYFVIGTNAPGCTDTASITLYLLAKPALQISRDTAICKAGSVLLNASGGNSYTWYPGTGLNTNSGNTVVASPLTTTTYYAIGTGSNGCTDTVKTTVTIIEPPVISITPALPSINKGQSVTLIAHGAQNYSWFPTSYLNKTNGDTVIASPLSTTTYTVTGADVNQCGSQKSVTVNVTTVGINTIANEARELIVFPNPASKILTIKNYFFTDLQVKNHENNFVIYDVTGRELIHKNTEPLETSVNISELPAGIYFVRVGNAARRFEKR